MPILIIIEKYIVLLSSLDSIFAVRAVHLYTRPQRQTVSTVVAFLHIVFYPFPVYDFWLHSSCDDTKRFHLFHRRFHYCLHIYSIEHSVPYLTTVSLTHPMPTLAAIVYRFILFRSLRFSIWFLFVFTPLKHVLYNTYWRIFRYVFSYLPYTRTAQRTPYYFIGNQFSVFIPCAICEMREMCCVWGTRKRSLVRVPLHAPTSRGSWDAIKNIKVGQNCAHIGGTIIVGRNDGAHTAHHRVHRTHRACCVLRNIIMHN